MNPITDPPPLADDQPRPRLRILYGHNRRILVIDRWGTPTGPVPTIGADTARDLGLDGVLAFEREVDLESEPITAEPDDDAPHLVDAEPAVIGALRTVETVARGITEGRSPDPARLHRELRDALAALDMAREYP